MIGGAKRCIDIDIVVVRHLFAAEQLGLCDVLIIVEAYDEKLELASRNLMGVTVLPVTAVDPVSLVRHERVLATVGAIRMLEEQLA